MLLPIPPTHTACRFVGVMVPQCPTSSYISLYSYSFWAPWIFSRAGVEWKERRKTVSLAVAFPVNVGFDLCPGFNNSLKHSERVGGPLAIKIHIPGIKIWTRMWLFPWSGQRSNQILLLVSTWFDRGGQTRPSQKLLWLCVWETEGRIQSTFKPRLWWLRLLWLHQGISTFNVNDAPMKKLFLLDKCCVVG